MHLLDRPTVFQETGGQIIQQLGMSWRGPPQSEIAGRRDQPLAKVMLPNAVHHDSGRQRIGSLTNQSANCNRPLPVASPETGSPPRISRNRLACSGPGRDGSPRR